MEGSEDSRRDAADAAGVRAIPASEAPRDEAPLTSDAHWARLESAEERGQLIASWAALLFQRVGARSGVLLLGPPDQGPFSPALAWPSAAPGPRLADAAARLLRERVPILEVPDAGADPSAPRALEGCVLGQPVVLGGALHGAVLVEVPPRPREQLQALLLELRWAAGWLRSALRDEEASVERSGRARLTSVLSATTSALEHERFQGAATAVATELATRLGCERASLGFVKRGRIRLRALSHSAHFGRKTNLVRAIEDAMNEVLDAGETLAIPESPDRPPQAARSHDELARRHGAGSICSVPLLWDDEVCGVLTLERDAERPFDGATIEECEAIASLAGPVLEVRRRDDRWIGAKLAESAGRTLRNLVGPHHVALKLGTALVLGLVLFLAFARGDYRVTADTVLEGSELRAASAPFRGYIAQAEARAGDVVEAGALLAALDVRDLRLERVKWLSETSQLDKQVREAMAERDAAQAEILAASMARAEAELTLVEDRLARAEVRAPFDGVVVSGDLSQQLGAPVEEGDVLFEVAPLDTYRVIVRVDEREIDEMAVGQEGQLVLTALPDQPLPIRVEKITPVAEAAEGNNTFRVEATLLEGHPRLRPGMEGVAKVNVDRRHLAWIWTHEAVDWIRLAVWKWIP